MLTLQKILQHMLGVTLQVVSLLLHLHFRRSQYVNLAESSADYSGIWLNANLTKSYGKGSEIITIYLGIYFLIKIFKFSCYC